jgi:hypothetical protein
MRFTKRKIKLMGFFRSIISSIKVKPITIKESPKTIQKRRKQVHKVNPKMMFKPARYNINYYGEFRQIIK